MRRAKRRRTSRKPSALTPHLAHALRGPLHLILGYTRLLEKTAVGEVADKLAIIEKNGEKLLQLIKAALGGDQEVAMPDEISPQPADRPADEYPAQQRTLLVVDDVEESSDLLCDLCSLWGYRVIQAADGAEAVAICQRADPPIDAVLVDQFMPVMDGWGVLRAVREHAATADLPVILISAAPAQRPQNVSPNLVFTQIFNKPLDADKLACYLRQLFGGPGWSEERILALSAESLAALRTMLELGQIVAIQRWAEALALTHPACRDFAGQVKQCCQLVDLAGLRRLLVQATISA